MAVKNYDLLKIIALDFNCTRIEWNQIKNQGFDTILSERLRKFDDCTNI